MDELQQLVGLQLPKSISWWPLAPGWYVILFLLVLILIVVFYKKRKKYVENTYRRTALLKLEQMSLADAQQLLTVLSQTLNHAVDDQVELSEDTFISALNKGIKQGHFNQQDWLLLTRLSFQAPNKEVVSEEVFSTLKLKCQQWVKEHKYEY